MKKILFPSETTKADQAPGRQRTVAQLKPITLFVTVRAIAGSDPMSEFKDFDRVYMPGMEGFVDSICYDGLSESRSDWSGLKSKAESISPESHVHTTRCFPC